jgi:hypothetical protein
VFNILQVTQAGLKKKYKKEQPWDRMMLQLDSEVSTFVLGFSTSAEYLDLALPKNKKNCWVCLFLLCISSLSAEKEIKTQNRVLKSVGFADVCIVGVARTPMGSLSGSLSSLTATKLGSIAIQGTYLGQFHSSLADSCCKNRTLC